MARPAPYYGNLNAGNNVRSAQTTLGTAQTGEVTDQALVEDRLTGLLDSDNPYIQNARQRTTEAAAARGLQNSSINAGAGERAAIEAALPIAQQDAEAYFQQGIENLRATNDMAKINVQEQNQTNRFNVGEQNKGILQDDEQAFKMQENDRAWAHELARIEKQTEGDLRKGYLDATMQVLTSDQSADAKAKVMQSLTRIAPSSLEAIRNIEWLSSPALDVPRAPVPAPITTNPNRSISFSEDGEVGSYPP